MKVFSNVARSCSLLYAVMVVMMAFRLVVVVFLAVMLFVMVVFGVMVVMIVVADHFDPGAGVNHHDALVRGHRCLADMVVKTRTVLEQQERLAGGGDLHEVIRSQNVVVGASGIRRGQQLGFDPGPVQNFAGQHPDRVCGRGDAVSGF